MSFNKRFAVFVFLVIGIIGGYIVCYKINLFNNSPITPEKVVAKSSFQELNQIRSVDIISSQRYLEMSRSYSVKKDYVNAEKNIKKAIELNPNNSVAYADLSGIYYETGRLDEALSVRQALVESIPKDKST